MLALALALALLELIQDVHYKFQFLKPTSQFGVCIIVINED